jgi:hypothetical protein
VTEAEWLSCTDPERLLELLRGKVSERKLRLFACACCRVVWNSLPPSGQRAVEVAERFADGAADALEMTAVRTEVLRDSRRAAGAASSALEAAHWACNNRPAESVLAACRAAANAAVADVPYTEIEMAHRTRLADQAALLRHIVGNPLQPATRVACPAQVLQLAGALYAGGDCAFALHDALLEGGHPELAAHFAERDHPKGCWALDLVLGKE